MPIRAYQVQPAGDPQAEVRANDGKNIKYEYGQRPEDEVFSSRPLGEDLPENLSTVANNLDYFKEKIERIIDNPYSGNSELKSYGGRSLSIANMNMLGQNSSIDRMYQDMNQKSPVKASSLVRQAMDDNPRARPNLQRPRFQQEPTYEDQYYQEYEEPNHLSLAEKLAMRVGNTNDQPRLFNRPKSQQRQANGPAIPGKQFIKPAVQAKNTQGDQELISKIRERRQQISGKLQNQQGESIQKREVTGEKLNFEEI